MTNKRELVSYLSDLVNIRNYINQMIDSFESFDKATINLLLQRKKIIDGLIVDEILKGFPDKESLTLPPIRSGIVKLKNENNK